jgi:DNA-binding IclR family transcriptional regulator
MTSRLDAAGAAAPAPQLTKTQRRRAREAGDEPATLLPEASSPGARLLTVLEAVAAFGEPVAAVDLVPRVGLPKPTVHRLCAALETLGFLQREPGTKRFVVGQRQQKLALDSLINAGNRGARHAVLEALAKEVGETVNVTVLQGNWVVYIDRVESHWPLRIHLQPGSRVPLHCGASGLLFLSLMPAAQRRRLLRAAPLQKYTENTVIDPDRIEERLKEIRRSRIGIEVEEFMRGLIGLAVPVYDGRGRICATVSMHAPTARFTVDEVRASVPALQRAADAISGLLVR